MAALPAGRHRAVQDHQGRAAPVGDAGAQRRLLGCRATRPRSTRSCCCRSRRPIRGWPRCARARSTGSRCRRPTAFRRSSRRASSSRPAPIRTSGRGSTTWRAKNSPLEDVRVRQALNYCIDRNAIVTLLNGTAEPSVGWLKPNDPAFGKPENRYTFDPAKGKKLLAEAGFTDKKPLSLQGDDLDLGLGPDAAAADERGAAGEPQAGLQCRRAGRRRRMAGAAERQPRRARQPDAERRDGAQRQLAVERRRHDVPLLRGGQLLAQRLQLRAVEGRQVRGGARRRWPKRPTPATIQKYYARRTSGWSTIRRGSTSCTTSTRAPSARR